MRIFIYILGILGLLLLILRIAGIYFEIPLIDIFLYAGLALILLFFIPLYSIDRHLRNRKINRFIQAFLEQEKKGNL